MPEDTERSCEALPVSDPDERPCTVCGAAYAPFGHGPPGVSFTREPDRFRWYCGAHRPDAAKTRLESSREQENHDEQTDPQAHCAS